jgi:hypothetical protein
MTIAEWQDRLAQNFTVDGLVGGHVTDVFERERAVGEETNEDGSPVQEIVKDGDVVAEIRNNESIRWKRDQRGRLARQGSCQEGLITSSDGENKCIVHRALAAGGKRRLLPAWEAGKAREVPTTKPSPLRSPRGDHLQAPAPFRCFDGDDALGDGRFEFLDARQNTIISHHPDCVLAGACLGVACGSE